MPLGEDFDFDSRLNRFGVEVVVVVVVVIVGRALDEEVLGRVPLRTAREAVFDHLLKGLSPRKGIVEYLD